MAWIILFIAGLLEVGWAVGLKASHGFSKPWIALATVVAMLASFVLLGLAVRTIPLGTGYAVWTGIGALGTVIMGMLLFGEPVTSWRLLFLGLIIVGILGLKLSG
ncbi:MAG: multidrug efflux SMR transporter [Pirellulaceae bacterium]|nr:multidrug efflux SMR transporter [Pirellulaceae bacterium]